MSNPEQAFFNQESEPLKKIEAMIENCFDGNTERMAGALKNCTSCDGSI